ncbi:hypothetical protein A9237_01065 [Vibrio owensii]|nr:hypothetical protein A9237_01065 [Vibrio owensii]
MTCCDGSLKASAFVLAKKVAVATVRFFSSIFILLYDEFLKCRYHLGITIYSSHDKEHSHIKRPEL